MMKLEILASTVKLKDLKPGDCFMQHLNSNEVHLVTFDEASGRQQPYWNYSKEAGVWAVNLKTGGLACWGNINQDVHLVEPTLQVTISRFRRSAS